MPLKLNLKAGEAILVNGAVIRNASQTRQALTIETPASVLRQSDVLPTDQAERTPAGMLHAEIVACMARPDRAATRHDAIHAAISRQSADVTRAQAAALRTVGRLVDDGAYYKALRTLDPVRRAQEAACFESPNDKRS